MLPAAGLLLLVGLAQGKPPVVSASTSAAPTRSELTKARDAIRADEAKALDALAATLAGAEAARVRSFIDPPPAADGSSRFVPLAEVSPKAPADRPESLAAIRRGAAAGLFRVASRSLKVDPPHLALADDCLRAVVARDPDHAEARRLLGFVPHGGGWGTPFAIKQLGDGLVKHPTFGWVDAAWVPHLDRGELPAPHAAGRPTRWLPAAEADALRRDFARGWQIRTEHFEVRTNVPLAEVIAFGRHLEATHAVFFSIMADLVGTDHPLAVLARTPGLVPTAPKKTHRVFYFAERDEFIRFLLPVQGEGVRDSLGTYLPAKESKRLGVVPGGTSFFFRDPGGQLDVTETLCHETSHQLLFESAGPDKYEEKRQNFWIYEGLGTYFETLRFEPDGSIRVGGLVGRRIESARKRLVVDGEFIPIGRFTTYNRFLFNGGNGNDIFLNYAESMALAVYLMQAHGGRHREAFLDYARDVYKGRLRPGVGKTLEDRLGEPLGAINRDFLAYLKAAKP